MNKLKITGNPKETRVYIDDVEIKYVKAVTYKQTVDSLPLATITFVPEIEIDNLAQITKKERAVYDKCGECKYLDLTEKGVLGGVCKHPDRKEGFGSRTAKYKQPSNKACKKFEKDGQ